MSETFAEQIERLELMADGDPQWDLSDNDRAAIRALLENYRASTTKPKIEGCSCYHGPSGRLVICPNCEASYLTGF